MKIEQSVIEALVATPSENLSVEVKQWIDPTSNHGVAKIAKGLLALRNQDGGFFVVGFDDKTLQPDPLVVIWRVTEAMAVGIAFAKGLDWIPQDTRLGFAFRWHDLKGRHLSVWSKPFYFDHLGGGRAEDDEVTSFVEFSLDTPLSALPLFVEEVTRKLFIAFNGATVHMSMIEMAVKQLLERTIG
jgi:hypothetical protein